MRLVEGCQFDTIYHEHYSYFSFIAVWEIFIRHELEIFDVDEIPEHGGSLRIYARHIKRLPATTFELMDREIIKGVHTINYYSSFQSKVSQIKHDLVDFLINVPRDQIVVGYGAAAKASTLLNYSGIRQDLVEFVVDRSPHKQGKYLPGSHIPVYDEEYLLKVQPDYVLILAWNLKAEIMEQLKYIRNWRGKFIIPIPNLEVI
jgi:hypothetical protein